MKGGANGGRQLFFHVTSFLLFFSPLANEDKFRNNEKTKRLFFSLGLEADTEKKEQQWLRREEGGVVWREEQRIKPLSFFRIFSLSL